MKRSFNTAIRDLQNKWQSFCCH